ncbi:hypothetical protein [Embleya sp. NBC_00896]|uniref:hypothetical protein n=1 Tax=Embleya sp. NBC_00896 TaxID=2975961 RepID=UPI002F915851|nr:hypothetical protein OG928_40855 [Embleya sp. NBC_00896]
MSGRWAARSPLHVLAALACATTLALAGCAAGDDEAAAGKAAASESPRAPQSLEQGPPPSIPAPRQLADMHGQLLPIEPYLLDLDQMRLIQNARSVLVSTCLKRRGFDVTLPVAAAGAGPNTQSEMRYGADRAAAAQYGYREPGAVQQPVPPSMSAAAREALAGKGGCVEEVDAEFAAKGLLAQDPDVVVNINVDNMQHSIRDERVTTAFRAWSDCMRAKGFDYATPMDASADRRWQQGSTASPQEIATAVAHSDCMRDNNVVGTWFAVESAYEQRDIDAHQAELADLKSRTA